MRASDLDLKTLLVLDPDGGVIRFAGQRALLFDALAMGLLRKHLVESFGLAAVRTVLTQFGFAHGYRMAEAMRTGFHMEAGREWRDTGARLHAFEGLFHAEPADQNPFSPQGMSLANSYEAEQHLAHFGRSDMPVCWTICGLISGYLSRVAGKKVYIVEDRCVGRGDAACHMVGRTREEWLDDQDDPHDPDDLELHRCDWARLEDDLDVSFHHVLDTIKSAEMEHLSRRRSTLRLVERPTGDVDKSTGLVTHSPAMRQLVDLTHRVAQVDSTVLITGESGTGKERIARILHEESARADGPFVAVNCGAVTETLLESELFGHARGAFTGATHDRPGLFEAAHRGTLLLDEIGDISPAMQVKLLRALQEREVRRVGENKSRPFDVRIVAATNRQINPGVNGSTFRQDLYYRIRVVELHVPALRDRSEDIVPLARVLLAEAALRMKRRFTGLAPAVADQLRRYAWPGNVRELENAVARAVALARGARIELEDLPDEIRMAGRPALEVHLDEVRPMHEVEKAYILAVLETNKGNQTRTAEQLQIGPATLYRKLKSYGLIAGRRPPSV